MVNQSVPNRHFPAMALLTALALVAPRAACGQALDEDRPMTKGGTETKGETESSTKTGELRQVKPDVYVEDKDGKRIYIPDISFEELDRLIQLDANLKAPAPPPYSFMENILLNGTADGNHAVLDLSVRVRLTDSQPPRTNESVRVPLRWNQAFPLPPPKYEGPGEFMISFEPDGDGYVWWVRAPPGTEHSLTLKAKIPLTNASGETQLSFLAPAAPLQLRLNVPLAHLVGRVGNGSQNILTKIETGEGGTQFLVDSAGGAVQLSWRARHETPPVLETICETLVTLDNSQLESEAKLKVRSHGAAIESFDVRLPPGMELLSFNQPGFQMSLVDEGPEQSTNQAGRLVRVKRVDGKSTDTHDVRLAAWMPPSQKTPVTPLETGGFEVVGAVRQRGTVDFVVQGDWSVDWIAGPNIRRTDDIPDAVRQQNVLARFEYYRQPYSLKVDVQPRQTRVSVEPTYLLYVESGHVRLEAALKYRISGARTNALKIDLTGWTVESVLPADIVSDAVSLAGVSPLSIPLSAKAQTGSGQLELKLLARRAVAAGDQPLSIPLPSHQESTSSPALIVVSPANNVQLIPRTEELKGLIPESTPPSISLPERRQAPLVYREENPVEPAVFVADFQLRERSVSVEVDTALQVDARQVDVQQRLSYSIAYASLRRLLLDTPKSLADAGQLRVLLDPNAPPLTVVPEEAAADATRRRVPVAVDLPAERIGPCQILLRYSWPVGELAPKAGRGAQVPLVQPVEGDGTTITTNTLRIKSAENLDVELQDKNWTPIAGGQSANVPPAERTYGVKGRVEQAAVAVVPRRVKKSTVVQRAWVQTWLTKTDRRDRACFRLTTNENRVQIQLPKGKQTDEVDVVLNGEPIAVALDEEGVIQIDLGEELASHRCTIELWYWFAANDAPLGRVTVEPPAVVGADRAKLVYWQLALPQDEHLLWAPGWLTSETTLQRQRFYWARHASLDHEELEALLQATNQPGPPTDKTNCYLFSSVGSLEPVTFCTVSLRLAVPVLSALALVFGLLLIYHPVLRHPAAVLVAGICLCAVGVLFPEPAVLAGQAAALGFVLVLIAKFLEWIVAGNRARRSVIRGSSYAGPDSRTAKMRWQPAEGSSGATTVTAPAPVHTTAVESES